jgi:DNA-binding NtrC family response regulator
LVQRASPKSGYLWRVSEISWIGTLVGAVAESRSLEEGAGAVLSGILQEVERSANRAQITGVKFLRAGMQLRTRDVVRFVHVVEPGSKTRDVARAYLPPTAAWQWIAQHGLPLVVEVQLSAAVSLDGKSEFMVPEPALSLSGPSIDRLRLRDSTHVLLLPLRTDGSTIGGALWIEAQAAPWIGRGFPGIDVINGLRLLADAIAPRMRMLTPRGSDQPHEVDDLLPVVGVNTSNLIELLKVFAASDETLLIAGPTGAGKSRLARWCHARSQRSVGPFEILDLMAVPPELQMAHLLGWKRGAFTGAVNEQPGALARASGGTLFIDEIDKLSLATQAGFLQLLEERVFRPLGDGGSPRVANVRVMVGTNADLQACMKARTFREDLYYRIHVLPVTLPSLDERKDEIPGWARFMARRRHSESGTNDTVEVTAEAMEMLCAASWPGNLRQLDNVVRRAYALANATNERAPVIDGERVRQALGFERGASNPNSEESLPDALRAVAARVVQHAQRQGSFLIKNLDGVRGMVVQAALEQTRSREAAANLLGLHEAVANRNHHRVLKRELEQARLLLQALGETGEMPEMP